MKRKYAPCYKCEDRVPMCHSSCERYKEYMQSVEEWRKRKRELTEVNAAIKKSTERRIKSRRERKGNG